MSTERNAEQRAVWDGPGGQTWARLEAEFERMSARHRARLMERAAVQPGERVLDIGCGNGATTREAARAAAPGTVVGLDLSAPMLERARALAAAEDLTNVTFVQADAQTYSFDPASVDVVISKLGVMFFDDTAAAFANIATALRPGGRMVLLVWQGVADNEWMTADVEAITGAPPGPEPDARAALGDPDLVRELLAQAGLTDVTLEDLRVPMDFGADLETAYAFLSQLRGVTAMLAELDPAQEQAARERLRQMLADHTTPDGVLLGSAAWVVHARRA